MSLPGVLTGVVPPVCTPLTPDHEVDVVSLERLVAHLVDGGVDGLFVLGSTSEAAYLPDRHRRTVVETVTGQVAGQLPVLAGALDMTAPRVLDHAWAANAAGADAVVVTAPFYTRTHPQEIARHYRIVAGRSELPVFAYDLPVSVHSKLSPELVLGLAGDGVLRGLKDSSGDEGGFRRVVLGRRTRAGLEHFSLLTGSELTVDAAFAMGADGVVPGLGNVDPHGYAKLARLCRERDWDGARDEQDRLAALFSIVDVGDPSRIGRSSSALGAFKAALHLMGVIACPVTADPQLPLTRDEVRRVGVRLQEAGLL